MRIVTINSTSTSVMKKGATLIELLIAMGIVAIILPSVVMGVMASRDGRAQQEQRTVAAAHLKEMQEVVKNIRDRGWDSFALNGTYHPSISGTQWTLASGPETVGDFTRSIVIEDIRRSTSTGELVDTGGFIDPSSKKLTLTVSWNTPTTSQVTATVLLTRYRDNLSFMQSSQADFSTGVTGNTAITNTQGGEVILSDNTKAKWCSPSFASSTIDLPDGPPVAVAAAASSSISVPNDVCVATAPTTSSVIKMAYVNVSADSDVPASSLRGTFTMDSSQYSAGTFPSGTGLDNNFKTNDIQYYKSASGKTYALLATDLPSKEVVAVQLKDGTTDAYQDPTNKIYKYWTYFNTRIYNPNALLSTGYTNPTANAADSGGDNNGYETNATRGYSSNNSYATDSNSGNGTSTNCTGADKDKHRFYNYGFSVPSGAGINGIGVKVEAKVDSQVGSPAICVQLSWDGGTSWTTAKSTGVLNTSDTTTTLGGADDNWGRTWSPSDFSNSNFRVRVIDVAGNTSRDFSLDWVGVSVNYSGDTSSNDQAPFNYGATTLTVLGDTGYVASGGYLYTFDLSNIDSKSPTNELDQIGCRIELHGYDCQPGSPAQDLKYSAGQTGTSWGNTGTPAHNTCADGGNIELYATNDLSAVSVNGHKYIYVAVGAGTDPELDIVDATNIPDNTTSPTINSASCGTQLNGNASWKVVGSKDFNSNSSTEEASNSVYAKSDGTRAYISSNGTSDSKQFYIINTSNKSSPTFLNEPPPTRTATSGFYQNSGANGEMYPRRSLTVLNGERVVLVGKDGVDNTNNAEEYQVLNSENETAPNYCGGVDFDQGFNDLTSVTEADGDTFVYMVANTSLNELKIIQGGPDGKYVASGTFESNPVDIGYNTAFNNFSANTTTPSGTSVQFQFAIADPVSDSCTNANYVFTGPDGTTGTYYATTSAALALNDDGTGYENPGRCIKYKAYLQTTDYNQTPVLNDITVNYSP